MIKKTYFLFLLFLLSTTFSQIGPKNVAPLSETLQFIENKGQWNNTILFKTEIPSGFLYLTKRGFVYTLYDEEKLGELERRNHGGVSSNLSSDLYFKEHTYQVNFLQSLPNPKVVGKNSYSTVYNYYNGSKKDNWASDVHGFQQISYYNIWDKIDMNIYLFNGTIKYEFIVHPNGDPNDIKLQYEGLDNISITKDGRLRLETQITTIQDHQPTSYQIIDNEERSVASSYKLMDSVQSFFIGKYDTREKLVIDPQLIFSTYSGSTADNWGNTACLDNEGNLYTGGTVFRYRRGTDQTFGTGQFPATIGAYQTSFRGGDTDIGILKFDSSGTTLLSATYIGGNDAEIPLSLVFDELNQELIVLAITGSTNFPVTSNAYQSNFGGGIGVGGDYTCSPFSGGPMVGGYTFRNGTDITIFKLSEDFKEFRSGTYLGGSDNDGVLYQYNPLVNNYGDQLRGDINVDEFGSIYLGSVTKSRNFPVKNALNNQYLGGEFDGIVAKFNSNLSDVFWNTYLGGSEAEMVFSIQFDQFKNVLIAGGTESNDFPTTNGVYQETHNGGVDGFITRLSSNGSSIMGSTFTGTAKFDQAYFVQQDQQYNAYIFGQTKGVVPIIPSEAYHVDNSGLFIQKFNYDLTNLEYSTTIGSPNSNPNTIVPNLSPTAFLVNECGHIFISGWGGATNSSTVNLTCGLFSTGYNGGNTRNMPITDNAYQKVTDGSDFYFASIDQINHRLIYSTYFGGPSSNEHVDGGTSRFDKKGIIYQSVCAGCGGNDDFPIFPALDNNSNTYPKLNNSRNCNNGVIKFDLATLISRINSEDICVEDEILFENNTVGGELFEWNFGDGTTFTTTQKIPVSHTYLNLGEYLATLRVTDSATCKIIDTSTFIVKVYEPKSSEHIYDTICIGDQKQISVTTYADDSSYIWRPETGLSEAIIPDPIVTGINNIQYLIEIVDTIGCIRTDTVDVFVPIVSDTFSFRIVNSCDLNQKPILQILSVGSSNSDSATFIWNFGDGTTSSETLPNHTYQTNGTYTLSYQSTIGQCVVDSSLLVDINSVYISNIFTPNNDGKNDFFTIQNHNTNENNFWKVELFNRWGKRVYLNTNYQNDYSANDLEDGTYYYLITSPDGTKCKNWVQITR